MTRHRLLRAATELLAEQGYERLTTGRVAERAGVAQPTFYVHFSDLDYTTDINTDLSNNAVNFAYSVSLGARYTFFGMLTFRAGPVLYYFRLDNFDGKTVNLMAVGGIASVSIEF